MTGPFSDVSHVFNDHINYLENSKKTTRRSVKAYIIDLLNQRHNFKYHGQLHALHLVLPFSNCKEEYSKTTSLINRPRQPALLETKRILYEKGPSTCLFVNIHFENMNFGIIENLAYLYF